MSLSSVEGGAGINACGVCTGTLATSVVNSSVLGGNHGDGTTSALWSPSMICCTRRALGCSMLACSRVRLVVSKNSMCAW